jgi:Putative phage serine protease XkdF
VCLSCGCMRPDDDHGDARHITRLVLSGAAAAAGIDIHQAAANIDATVGGSVEKVAPADIAYGVLAKSAADQRYSLGVAFPALKPEVRKAADGKRDVIGPEANERAAWAYMQKSRRVGLWHADGTEGHGEVVESYIYRGPDWAIATPAGSEQVIKAGDWLMGVVWDEPAWAAIRKGLIDGLSPQGTARRRPAPADLAASSR